MPSLKPDRDKNFGGSLVFDFGQWWRHVKTIYMNNWLDYELQYVRTSKLSLES